MNILIKRKNNRNKSIGSTKCFLVIIIFLEKILFLFLYQHKKLANYWRINSKLAIGETLSVYTKSVNKLSETTIPLYIQEYFIKV